MLLNKKWGLNGDHFMQCGRSSQNCKNRKRTGEDHVPSFDLKFIGNNTSSLNLLPRAHEYKSIAETSGLPQTHSSQIAAKSANNKTILEDFSKPYSCIHRRQPPSITGLRPGLSIKMPITWQMHVQITSHVHKNHLKC